MCVKYVRTHTNHTPELKHVPLSKSVREEVRQKYYGENRKIGFYSGRYVFCLSVKVLYTFVYTYVGIRGSLQVVVIEKSSYVRLLERHLSQGKMPETLFVQWTMP